MKAREFQELSSEELKIKEGELREELFNLRFRHSTGQLENTARLKQVKKDIARIATVLQGRSRPMSEEKIEATGK